MTSRPYREALRAPAVAWLLSTSLLARLPLAMVNLAIIIRISRATGSYARAGIATAVYVVGAALVMPLVGRLTDRAGRRPVLLAAGMLNAIGLFGLAFVSVRDTAPLLVVAAFAGASTPPVTPAVRSLWRHLVPPDLLSGLFAMDATLQEVTFMIGPSLVAVTVAVASPSAALVTCGLIGLGGTLGVAAHPAVAMAFSDERGSVHPPNLAGLVTLVSVMVVFLAAIVMIEVAIVAFTGDHHASNQSGLLLSVWAGGSVAGGLLFGARMARLGANALASLLVVGALGFALLSLAPGVAVLYGLMFLAGIAIAPTFSCVYGIVSELAPHGSSVEAFSWISSGIQVGSAIGAAVGGLLVESLGARMALLCAAGCTLSTVAIAALGRQYLPGRPDSIPLPPGSANQ